MDLKLVSSSQDLQQVFEELLVWAEQVDIVQAWATSSGGQAVHWKLLAAHSDKLHRVIVGVSFLQTEPSALRDLHRWSQLRVVHEAEGTFHPKLVLARRGQRGRALIGSANLTTGAFGPNIELGVLVGYDHGDALMTDLHRFIEGLWSQAVPVTTAWLDAYEVVVSEDAASAKPPAKPPTLPPREGAKIGAPSDVVSHGIVGGPFENDLPLDLPQRRWAGEAPATVIALGLMLTDPVSWPFRHHTKADPPHLANLMKVARGPCDGGEIWFAGANMGGIAAAIAPRSRTVSRAIWDVPIGEWALEDLAHACLVETMTINGVELGCEAHNGAERVLHALQEPEPLVELLGSATWRCVGRIAPIVLEKIIELKRATMRHHDGVLVTLNESGVALTGRYDDIEFRHEIGPPVDGEAEIAFPALFLQDRIWLDRHAELLLHDGGLVALRAYPGLAFVASCAAVGSLGIREQALLQSSDTGLPDQSLKGSFITMFSVSAMWLLGSPGHRPCATISLLNGMFEVADFRWPRNSEHYFALNLTVCDSLENLQPRANTVTEAASLEFGSWSLSKDGRTVQAVSFELIGLRTPVELTSAVYEVLVVMWGRAPRLSEVHEIHWRYLAKEDRGREAKRVRYARSNP